MPQPQLNKRLLGTVNRTQVFAVDGNQVKLQGWDEAQDFCEGGNSCRYPFVPQGEVWIDARMDPSTWRPIILHEIIESTLMGENGNLPYSQAHPIANRYEMEWRRELGIGTPGNQPSEVPADFQSALEREWQEQMPPVSDDEDDEQSFQEALKEAFDTTTSPERQEFQQELEVAWDEQQKQQLFEDLGKAWEESRYSSSEHESVDRNPGWWEFVICTNKADCDSGELGGIPEDEMERLRKEWQSLSNKERDKWNKQASSQAHNMAAYVKPDKYVNWFSLASVENLESPPPATAIEIAEKIASLPYDGDPGYGHVFYNPDTKEAWIMGSDGTPQEIYDEWKKQLSGISGVNNVRAESETPPSEWTKGSPWIRINRRKEIAYDKTLSKYSMSNSEIEEAVKSWKEPSDAQCKSENYKKPRINLHGIEIAIENPKGTIRKAGWKPLAAHYGYLSRVAGERAPESRDGDKCDCFIGPHPKSEIVFVIDQEHPSGRFDEHKCVMGCFTEAEAKKLYLDSYQDGWHCGPITALTINEFKEWLKHGDATKRIAEQVSRYMMEDEPEKYLFGIGGHDVSMERRDAQGHFTKEGVLLPHSTMAVNFSPIQKDPQSSSKILQAWQEAGFDIVICTSDEDTKPVTDWLHEHRVPFTKVTYQQPGVPVDAHVYLADNLVPPTMNQENRQFTLDEAVATIEKYTDDKVQMRFIDTRRKLEPQPPPVKDKEGLWRLTKIMYSPEHKISAWAMNPEHFHKAVMDGKITLATREGIPFVPDAVKNPDYYTSMAHRYSIINALKDKDLWRHVPQANIDAHGLEKHRDEAVRRDALNPYPFTLSVDDTMAVEMYQEGAWNESDLDFYIAKGTVWTQEHERLWPRDDKKQKWVKRDAPLRLQLEHDKPLSDDEENEYKSYSDLVRKAGKQPLHKHHWIHFHRTRKVQDGVKEDEKLKGGKGDDKPDSDFNPKALKHGTEHEKEHTEDKSVAKEIAKDHLTEDKSYYEKLKRIES